MAEKKYYIVDRHLGDIVDVATKHEDACEKARQLNENNGFEKIAMTHPDGTVTSWPRFTYCFHKGANPTISRVCAPWPLVDDAPTPSQN